MGNSKVYDGNSMNTINLIRQIFLNKSIRTKRMLGFRSHYVDGKRTYCEPPYFRFVSKRGFHTQYDCRKMYCSNFLPNIESHYSLLLSGENIPEGCCKASVGVQQHLTWTECIRGAHIHVCIAVVHSTDREPGEWAKTLN